MSDFLDDRQVNASVASAAWVDSAKGTKGIRFSLDFEHPEEDPLGNGAASIRLDVWISPKPNALSMTYKTLKTLGVDTDTVDAHKFKYEINELFEGAKVRLVCGLEAANEYHSDDQWKVKFVNDYAATGGESVDPLALLRTRPHEVRKPKAKKEATLPLTSSGPVSKFPEPTDDVPF